MWRRCAHTSLVALYHIMHISRCITSHDISCGDDSIQVCGAKLHFRHRTVTPVRIYSLEADFGECKAMPSNIHTYTHTYIHTYIHTCMYIRIHVYTHIYMCEYAYAYAYAYVYPIHACRCIMPLASLVCVVPPMATG